MATKKNPPRSTRADQQTEQHYRQASGRRPTARQIAEHKRAVRNRKIAIITVCSAILVILLGIIFWMIPKFFSTPKDDGRILDNVYAGGVNLSGLTKEEARNALHLATDNTFSRRDMVIKLPDATITLPADKTGAKLDVDKVVEVAYEYGRNGSATENKKVQANAATTSYTIALLSYMELDTRYIHSTLQEFCNSYSSVMKQPTATLSGERPVYDVEYPNKPVTHQTLTITMGTPDYKLDANRLYDRVLDAYSLNQLEITYESPNQIDPKVPVAQDLFNQYCDLPEDAKLDAKLNIIPEVYGYGFDVEALQDRIDNAKYGDTIEITLNFLLPVVTEKELSENVLPDVLIEYVCSNPEATPEWIHNLTLASNAINGTVLNSGDMFSFNQLLGRISEANGFKKAPGYVRGMEAQVLGAGVEQLASALYYCALMCDFTVLERHNNGYVVNYIDLGFDAYITNAQDLRFTNTSDYPIRITTSVDGNSVTVLIEGNETRIFDIELVVEINSKTEPTTTYQVMDKDNVYGYENGHVLVSGITGYTVTLYRHKYNKQTDTMVSRMPIATFEYSKRDQIEVQIESETIPEPEPEPEPDQGGNIWDDIVDLT